MPGDDDLAAVFSAIRLRSERARGAVAHGRKRAAHTGCRSSLRFRDFSTSSKLVDTLPCARRGVRAHGRAASAITDVSFPRDSAAPVGAGSNRMCSPRRLDARVHEQRPTQPFPSPRSRSPSAPLAPEVRPQNERLTNRRFRRPRTARTCRCHRRQDHSPERSSTCASLAAATWACRPRRRGGRVARGRTQQKRPRSKDQGRGRPTGASQTVRTAHRELDRPDA